MVSSQGSALWLSTAPALLAAAARSATLHSRAGFHVQVVPLHCSRTSPSLSTYGGVCVCVALEVVDGMCPVVCDSSGGDDCMRARDCPPVGGRGKSSVGLCMAVGVH